MVFLDCPPDIFISAYSEYLFATDIGWPDSASSHGSVITPNCLDKFITPTDHWTATHPLSIKRAPLGNDQGPTTLRHMGKPGSKIEFMFCSFLSYIRQPSNSADNGTWAVVLDMDIQHGGKETCCCTAEETALCNRAWTYHSFFPIFTTVELLKVFGLLGLILFVYCLLRRFIRKRTFFVTKEIADDLLRTIVRVETNLAVLKVLMLLAFILIAWFPVQYTCKLHNEGIFNTPYYVLMQLPYFDDVGILYSCLPLLSLLFDFERLRLISKGVFSAAEIISVVSFILLLSNFCLLGGLFIEYDSLKEAEKQEKYCKLGWAQWTTVTSAVLLVMHCITTILSEVWTWYLYQKNDKLLKENDIRTTTSAVEVTTQSPLNTACIETLIEEDEHVVITPAPFCLDRNGEGVLTVVNRHPQHWIAVRILVSAPNAYSTHPKKLILPPQRSATTEIRLLKCSTPVSGSRQGVMIQWFAAGSSCPPMDAERIWLRPFFRPQSEWKCYILPIYHETETEEG